MQVARIALSDTFAQARAGGWPLALGFAALGWALVSGTLMAPAARRDAAGFGDQADVAAHHTRHAADAGSAAASLEPGPARFVAAFPAVAQRQARVATLLELAARHGLEIRRSEFQLVHDRASGLVRYTVTMPLAGTYAQLRGFVEDALTTDAALSLDHLRLHRAAADVTLVEADLAWSFYMRPAAASGASQ